MKFSPIMFDLMGTELSEEEREIIQHPMIGGVILFSRNYESIDQVTQLTQELRSISQGANHSGYKGEGKAKSLLIAVDHEGGRVQRFRHEFTELPAVATLGSLYTRDKHKALHASRLHGWLMASEVKSVGIDFSFAPVLDLDYEISSVIGDRAFHTNSQIVTELGAAYTEGMKDAGMASTGKHFPGHGAIKEDSHLALPIDKRTYQQIYDADMQPFIHLFNEGLDAVMPAHVVYSEIDSNPAGFSRIWLQDILRKKIGFKGAIFSDDLTMEGASVMGGYTERAEAAMEAGCDMILVCNKREAVTEILDQIVLDRGIWDPKKEQLSYKSAHRLKRMQGESIINRSALLESKYWLDAVGNLSQLT